ncbi:hypothetical protein [Clostridium gasigenes]|uniref:hypothetical protein n=1 Tax=Clostridium gasigenes TaxID=94869 RepID=UPI001C0E78D2|nr:hypothetical protein [Clostridium gasigenes]MBU3105029.1 hypothetical protein [Clostridium gasigenes]
MVGLPWWQYVISMSGFIIFLLLLIDFMRKHPKFTNLFWIAGLCTFPVWIIGGGVVGWFRWSKTLSMLLPIVFLSICRIAHNEQKKGKMWGFIQKKNVIWFFYAILFLNIMEATIKDVTLGNYLNALCGFLLCVTIPFAPKFWGFTAEKPTDLVSYTTVSWNFIYTTWNACFVFAESPKGFASTCCILIAAELYPIIKKRPELYIISRVYTLAFLLLLKACLPNVIPTLMESSSWYNSQVLYYWGLANFIIIVPYVFWHTWQLHTGKCDVSFRRGKIDKIKIDKVEELKV